MGENEVSMLSRKLDDIMELVYPMSERMKDLPELKTLVAVHEKAIPLLEADHANCRKHCEEIQEAKKSTQINWGTVKGSVIGGIVLCLFSIAVGIFIGALGIN